MTRRNRLVEKKLLNSIIIDQAIPLSTLIQNPSTSIMSNKISNFNFRSFCKQQPLIFLRVLGRGIEKNIGLVTKINTQDIIMPSGLSKVDRCRGWVAACFNFTLTNQNKLKQNYVSRKN